MPSATLTSDAVIAPYRLFADAWIVAEHWRHHRVYDHYGIESDLYVALSEQVGKYAAYTPVHFVLEDMIARIEALESSSKRRASFTFDAWIATSGTYGMGVLFTDAIVFRSGLSDSFTIDAVITRGGAFTVDAYVAGGIRVDAFIV